MRRLRRSRWEPRIELTPLIDIMVFLMTFFIYSLVLVVQVDILPMELRTLVASREATPAPAVTVSIDLDGNLYFNREAIELEEIAPRLQRERDREPRTVFYLAIAEGATEVDRAPLLQDVLSRVHASGVPISLVGRPRPR
ncbi:MAG: biopolymer transporter ExbD [Phycisphaeraceae bacterium]|nr:biopolymer transporter ExbD [Phycisphaeraceae bacterium]